MFKSKKFLKIIVLILSITLFLVGSIYAYPWFIKSPEIKQNTPSTKLLNYLPQWNFRQTINDCGPFSVAAAYRSATGENINSQDFVDSISYRVPNKFTYPLGLEEILKSKKLKPNTPTLLKLSNQERLKWVRQELAENHPVIILGAYDEKGWYRHYITVVGYDENKGEFYIYDSLVKKSSDPKFTIDTNENLPGNTTWSNQEVLNFWSKSGYFGVYQWYAIAVSKN